MAWSKIECLDEHSLASYADARSRRFLALFLIALLRVKTVNLVEIATGFAGKAKTESNYKRLQRFFREFELDYYPSYVTLRKQKSNPNPRPFI